MLLTPQNGARDKAIGIHHTNPRANTTEAHLNGLRRARNLSVVALKMLGIDPMNMATANRPPIIGDWDKSHERKPKNRALRISPPLNLGNQCLIKPPLKTQFDIAPSTANSAISAITA